jgi:hypothetical protein
VVDGELARSLDGLGCDGLHHTDQHDFQIKRTSSP